MNAAGIISKPARALVLASGLLAATSIVGFAQDVPVGFGAVGNFALTNSYVNPPTGTVSLGGHQFDFSSGNMIRIEGGQSASISGSYPNATAAYVLINSYNTWTNYTGQSVSRIVLTFSDGTTQTTTLIVGANIREWRPNPLTVNTATDANLATVWTGEATQVAGGGTAIIDMLTIPVTGQYKTLTNLSITDDNLNGLGLLVQGVTIDDGPAPQPVCIRQGNSCSTPAADNSQSSKWQPVLPGATTNVNPQANISNSTSGHGHGNGNANGHSHKVQ